MSVLSLKYESDPILRRKSVAVRQLDRKIRRLLDDMLETMYATKGVGLAAPQVGINKRMVVVDVGEEGHGPWKLVNPRIVEYSDEEELGGEGCLSCPGVLGDVWRSAKVKVRAVDYNGDVIEFTVEGFEARCFQHELDHLDGILFIDKAENLRDVDGIEAEADGETDNCADEVEPSAEAVSGVQCADSADSVD